MSRLFYVPWGVTTQMTKNPNPPPLLGFCGCFTGFTLLRMPTDVRKTPSYLKGLAETRARASGEMIRLQRLLDEIDPQLAEAQRIQAVHADTMGKLAAAQAERDACDLLIRKFDDRLNPDEIAPIRAFKGRYGKRGELKALIVDVLRRAFPAEVTTTELCVILAAELQLDFENATARGKWVHNSVGNALKDLVKAGVLERLHAAVSTMGTVGRWKLKDQTPQGLDSLRATAGDSGVAVGHAKRRGRPRKSEQTIQS